MKVTFLGTASCFPTPQRGVSCTAVQLKDGQVWLFDAGEGTQIQLQKSQVKPGRINKIFITHLHGDHCFGLPGLLCTLGNGTNHNPDGDQRVVTVYGPKGIRKMVNTALELSRSPLSFLLEIVELIPDPEQYPEDWGDWKTDFEYQNEVAADLVMNKSSKVVSSTTDKNGNKYWEVFKREGCDHVVRAGILKHRIPCFGYVIRENNQPGPLDAKKVREKGLTPGPDYHKLKMGQDVTLPDGKTVIRASEVTGAPVPGRKVVVMGDTCDSYGMAHLCEGADLLLHEATMENALMEKAVTYGHSTPEMAARFAVKTRVKRLCLFHLSPRYRPSTTSEDGDAICPPEGGQETGEKLKREAEQAVKDLTSGTEGRRREGLRKPQVYVAEDFMVLEVPPNKLKVASE